MPNMILETKQDIDDFVRGASFLGTGGGGNSAIGRQFLYKCLEDGKKLQVKDIDEISDGGWSSCAFRMGSIAPETNELKKRKEYFGLIRKNKTNTLIEAVKELEIFTRKIVTVIVPLELGGSNTPGPFEAAIRLNKTIVDGDYSARAVPEIVQTAAHINHKSVFPIAAVDEYGNRQIIKNVINNRVAERFGKLFSQASFGIAGEAGIMMKVSEMKKIIQQGTLSKAYTLGKSIRTAKENGKSPVEIAINSVKGHLLFEGKVSRKEWEDRDGYMWGTHTFNGTGKFSKKKFKIWFKNENHISWLDDKPYVTSPDLIEVVRRKDAEPITNTDLAEGEEVAIIGMKANPLFRTEEGLKVLGPKYFGFDYEYVPLEKLVEE